MNKGGAKVVDRLVSGPQDSAGPSRLPTLHAGLKAVESWAWRNEDGDCSLQAQLREPLHPGCERHLGETWHSPLFGQLPFDGGIRVPVLKEFPASREHTNPDLRGLPV